MQRILLQLVKEKLIPLNKPYNKLPLDVLGGVISDFKAKYPDAYKDDDLKERVRKQVGQQRWWDNLSEARKSKYREDAKKRQQSIRGTSRSRKTGVRSTGSNPEASGKKTSELRREQSKAHGDKEAAGEHRCDRRDRVRARL